MLASCSCSPVPPHQSVYRCKRVGPGIQKRYHSVHRGKCTLAASPEDAIQSAAEHLAGIASSSDVADQDRPLGFGQASLAFAAAAALAGISLSDALYEELKPKRCQNCLGTGYTICTSCQGRGRLGLSLPGEPLAVRTCNQCNKRGHMKCDNCNATGISNYWLWQPASDPGWGPRGS